MIATPVNAWHLALDRDVCTDVEAGLNHEWLATNGLGGYAAGTLNGATTRSYHGLLVAALRPPVERYVLVTKIDEEIEITRERSQPQIYKLGVNEYQDGTIDPRGYNYLKRFAIDGDIPIFIYQLNPHITLEKRVWMEYGQNTTYVQYEMRPILDEEASKDTIMLHLLPFCLYRDHHATTQGSNDWRFQVDNERNSIRVRADNNAPTAA